MIYILKNKKIKFKFMKDTELLNNSYFNMTINLTIYINIHCHRFEQTCFYIRFNLLLFDLHITSVNFQMNNRQYLIFNVLDQISD